MNYLPKRWQIWVSYLYPIVLDSSASAVSDHLEVVLTRGKIQLCTDKAVYSFEQRYDNFRKLFDRLDMTAFDHKSLLCLGLGMGSVIQLIAERTKNPHITAIELDEEVIRLAEKYILHKVDMNVEVVAADAGIFVEMTDQQYDLICMDVFIDDEIPDRFLLQSFCESLSECLSEDGFVIYNAPAFDKTVARASKKFFNEVFLKVFPQGRLLRIHRNHMLLSHDRLLRG